jgi:hypothetical protein
MRAHHWFGLCSTRSGVHVRQAAPAVTVDHPAAPPETDDRPVAPGETDDLRPVEPSGAGVVAVAECR